MVTNLCPMGIKINMTSLGAPRGPNLTVCNESMIDVMGVNCCILLGKFKNNNIGVGIGGGAGGPWPLQPSHLRVAREPKRQPVNT